MHKRQIPLTDPIDGKLNIHQWQEALQITAESNGFK